jgi:glycosyltransferase involved in cell wall biosynthesis
MHAHYATSYGFLGALSCFHPFILSFWGSDVFSFPRKSAFHRYLLKYNIRKADRILSTSDVMAREINLYSKKHIDITPFGIDTEVFKPEYTNIEKKKIVIGIIKSLEKCYGIEYLIKAFSLLKTRLPEIPMELLIVGDGSIKNELVELTKKSGVAGDTMFTGRIEYDNISKYHNMLDIAVYPSIEESFGVAVLESSSCGKPVVAARTCGLEETVIDNVTGFFVTSGDEVHLADVLEKLVMSKELRKRLGDRGREMVQKKYSWEESLKTMLGIYKNILSDTEKLKNKI